MAVPLKCPIPIDLRVPRAFAITARNRRTPANDTAPAWKPRGRIPTPDAFTTLQGTVVELRPDQIGRRLSHQVFMVQVQTTTSPAVHGQVLEVDHDITPGIGGPRVPLTVGQDVAIRGVLWHDDDDHDGTIDRAASIGPTKSFGDAGCIAAHGDVFQQGCIR
jgi:hypothetical protein